MQVVTPNKLASDCRSPFLHLCGGPAVRSAAIRFIKSGNVGGECLNPIAWSRPTWTPSRSPRRTESPTFLSMRAGHARRDRSWSGRQSNAYAKTSPVRRRERSSDTSSTVVGRARQSGFGRIPQGFHQGWLGAAAPPELWRLRLCLSARVLDEPSVAARPRLCLRHRAHPRRRRSRLSLVSRRQAGETHQHLQRFRRRHALSDRQGLHRARPRHRGGRFRRR